MLNLGYFELIFLDCVKCLIRGICVKMVYFGVDPEKEGGSIDDDGLPRIGIRLQTNDLYYR